MSAFYQAGSTGMDPVVQREIEERIRRARAMERVREARGRSTTRFSLGRLLSARLVSAVRVALRAPGAGLARQTMDRPRRLRGTA